MPACNLSLGLGKSFKNLELVYFRDAKSIGIHIKACTVFLVIACTLNPDHCIDNHCGGDGGVGGEDMPPTGAGGGPGGPGLDLGSHSRS